MAIVSMNETRDLAENSKKGYKGHIPYDLDALIAAAKERSGSVQRKQLGDYLD